MTILMSRCFIAPIPTCVRCATLPKRVCNTRGPNLKLNSVQVLPYRPRAALNRQDQSHSGKITHVAVLVSGGGRSLANLCERINLKLLTNVEICAVIASKSKAGAIGIAQRNGLPVHVICAKDYPSGASEHSTAITDVLRSYEPDLVIMAGWMHFYQIPAHFAGRVLNIHPSLIPAFCGKGFYGNKVHKAAVRFSIKSMGKPCLRITNNFLVLENFCVDIAGLRG